jgi:hypothetical protein
MDFETATPEGIGEAIADALADHPPPAGVERDGARRAAGLIATLL